MHDGTLTRIATDFLRKCCEGRVAEAYDEHVGADFRHHNPWFRGDAAALMGIRVDRIYAITFGLGALMAGACGSLLAVVYPVTTMMADQFLGKAFVVCVIGGLGSVPGALAGGLALGLIESVSGHLVGPQHAMTIGFSLMILLLMTRPTGLLGTQGYE